MTQVTISLLALCNSTTWNSPTLSNLVLYHWNSGLCYSTSHSIHMYKMKDTHILSIWSKEILPYENLNKLPTIFSNISLSSSIKSFDIHSQALQLLSTYRIPNREHHKCWSADRARTEPDAARLTRSNKAHHVDRRSTYELLRAYSCGIAGESFRSNGECDPRHRHPRPVSQFFRFSR